MLAVKPQEARQDYPNNKIDTDMDQQRVDTIRISLSLIMEALTTGEHWYAIANGLECAQIEWIGLDGDEVIIDFEHPVLIPEIVDVFNSPEPDSDLVWMLERARNLPYQQQHQITKVLAKQFMRYLKKERAKNEQSTEVAGQHGQKIFPPND